MKWKGKKVGIGIEFSQEGMGRLGGIIGLVLDRLCFVFCFLFFLGGRGEDGGGGRLDQFVSFT